jgi:phospholipid-translocating ATPase
MVNNREVLRLEGNKWVKCKWFEVIVGDIIKIMNDEMIPADLFILSSSNADNESYVETAELDG